jgi:hypothetical protein
LVQVYGIPSWSIWTATEAMDADFTFVLDETTGRSEWIRSRQLVLERQQNARGDARR